MADKNCLKYILSKKQSSNFNSFIFKNLSLFAFIRGIKYDFKKFFSVKLLNFKIDKFSGNLNIILLYFLSMVSIITYKYTNCYTISNYSG